VDIFAIKSVAIVEVPWPDMGGGRNLQFLRVNIYSLKCINYKQEEIFFRFHRGKMLPGFDDHLPIRHCRLFKASRKQTKPFRPRFSGSR